MATYEQEDFVFDPLHYLSLLEQVTNALGSEEAAPLAVGVIGPGAISTPEYRVREKRNMRDTILRGWPPDAIVPNTSLCA